MLQPDRGAKRLREEDGGGAAGEEDTRGGKQHKVVRELARQRDAAGGGEGGEMRDMEEMAGDRKKILEKLMDQDEEEPEVGELVTGIFELGGFAYTAFGCFRVYLQVV